MKRSLELAKMNLRVGILALAGFLILLWTLFFPVRGVSFFTSKITVKGYYEDVDGLKRNAPVYFRGTEVGTVKSVRIDETREKAPLEVVINFEERIQKLLPQGTVMHIVALGLLGDVFISLENDGVKPGQQVLKDGDVLPTLPYASVLDGMNGMTDKVKEMLDKLNSLLARAQDKDTSVGRLFREDDLYVQLVAAVKELKNAAAGVNKMEDTVNTKLLDAKTKESVDKAVATAQRVLDKADDLTAKADAVRWNLTLGFSKYQGSLYGATVGMRIVPDANHFYEGGLAYFNQSTSFTAQDTFDSGYAEYDIDLGWRILSTPFFFRGGLKRSSPDVGLDWRMQEWLDWLPLELKADAYHFGNPKAQFDIGLEMALLKAFRLTAGVEDIANTPQFRMGLTLIYDDEDLTSILVKSKF